jgi:hypothetical protein
MAISSMVRYLVGQVKSVNTKVTKYHEGFFAGGSFVLRVAKLTRYHG